MSNEIRLDFLIIGAQKSGTTTLHHALRGHPALQLPLVKEIEFFFNDELYQRGPAALRPYFSADIRPGTKLGLSHVKNMFYHEITVPRIKTHNPDLKLIALLREPASRACSAFWQKRRIGREKAPDLAAALEREWPGDRAADSYLSHGLYAEQLLPFIDCFGRRNLYVALFEEFITNPKKILNQIAVFLGVRPFSDEAAVPRLHNRAALPRRPWLESFFRSQAGWKKLYKKLLPESWRLRLVRPLVYRLQERNLQEIAYPPIDAETAARLADFYREPNRRLAALLDLDLSAWEKDGA